MHLDLRSHAETRERVPGAILAELESADDGPDVEAGVLQFVDWVKLGKLEVRVFPSEKLHAKVYIMTFWMAIATRAASSPGRAISRRRALRRTWSSTSS